MVFCPSVSGTPPLSIDATNNLVNFFLLINLACYKLHAHVLFSLNYFFFLIAELKISVPCIQKLFSGALLGKAQRFLSTLIAARSQEVALAGSTFGSRSPQQLLALLQILLPSLENKIILLFKVGSLDKAASRGGGWQDWLVVAPSMAPLPRGCRGDGWVWVVPALAGGEFQPEVLRVSSGEFKAPQTWGPCGQDHRELCPLG